MAPEGMAPLCERAPPGFGDCGPPLGPPFTAPPELLLEVLLLDPPPAAPEPPWADSIDTGPFSSLPLCGLADSDSLLLRSRSSFSMIPLTAAIEVIDDFEKSRSASLNLRLRLSALLFVFLFGARYRSQPRMMFPYSWVSSK